MQAAGGWGPQVVNKAYASMPAGDALANKAGFSSRDTVMVWHYILDPARIPEFQPMMEQLYQGVEAMLAELQQVQTSCHSLNALSAALSSMCCLLMP